MEDLNDLALFAMVVEHRGFSAASRELGIPKSRLSRRVAQLEARLGVRLLQRNSRNLTPTSVGQAYYERCREVVMLATSATDVIDKALAEPQGTLRVSCPISLAQFWLTPLLSVFMRAHPKVVISLAVTNRPIDLLNESMDVVLRVRRPPLGDSGMVVRPLARTADILVGSPTLSAQFGAPSSIKELQHWPTLSMPVPGDQYCWRLRSVGGLEQLVHRPRLITDDMFALKSAALDGTGIALLPPMICAAELEAGTLRAILPDWSAEPGEIQAVFPSRRGMLPAVRAFVDFLIAHPPDEPFLHTSQK
ncbi:LysR substrate-binding domain-containing protein [Variovorax davisae]|uniref:LysR substrate-binding domain-containing protein n=1 Tax=Variovorax davisae TaxID=3053515 RepID=UPI002575EB7D|nr:LysR substrate-binding domain-containing protein [Variovorax sp. J22P271]